MNADVEKIRKALDLTHSTPVEHAQAMPSAYYTSDAFTQLEEEHIFRKEWVCLGRADEVAAPGQYYTTSLVGEPLLVTCSKDGEISVLSNVCRHRGNIVASGSGNKSRFSCSYHAWTYDLKGQLVGAPHMQDVDGFDLSSCALPAFQTEIWQGFLFVNLSGDATPLAPRLEALVPYIENYEIGKRPYAFTKDAIWNTNWKCLAENFMEGYHLDVTHPKTLRPLTPTALCEHVPSNGHFNAYYSYYDPDYPERGPFPPSLPIKKSAARLCSVFFQTLWSLQPPVFLSTSASAQAPVMPVNIRWGMSSLDEDNPITDEQIAFMDTVNLEDKAKLETLQKGLQSRYYKPGRLSKPDLEGTIYDMYRYMANRLGSSVNLG
jgi:phenylpropionate dioxygenase-like ring-hydroxylating dioxygenase large terminal subunit